MTKYITIVIVSFLMLGCGTKTPAVKAKKVTKQVATEKVQQIQEVQTVQEISSVENVTPAVEEPKIMTLPEGFREVKKLRRIGANVPKTCQEWSDGCNTCSREQGNQASCTVYTCETKAAFSCLKWQ